MAKAFKHWDKISADEQIKRWQGVERVMMSLTRSQIAHLDMQDWASKIEDCGTHACAAGYCGLDPEFRRQGFIFDFAKKPDRDGVYEMTAYTDPVTFFGLDGTEKIFTGAFVYETGSEARKAVLKAVRAYIEVLQARKEQNELSAALALANAEANKARAKYLAAVA